MKVSITWSYIRNSTKYFIFSAFPDANTKVLPFLIHRTIRNWYRRFIHVQVLDVTRHGSGTRANVSINYNETNLTDQGPTGPVQFMAGRGSIVFSISNPFHITFFRFEYSYSEWTSASWFNSKSKLETLFDFCIGKRRTSV